MAQVRPSLEGNYASPQTFRSGSFSELGLTLLPSHQTTNEAESNDHGVFPSEQNGGAIAFESTWGGFGYPSSTPTLGQLERLHDLPTYPENVSNGGLPNQASSTVTENKPNKPPLFVHPRSIDRSGCVANEAARPTYFTPVQYIPSAPHLHIPTSTGTTLAAAERIDRLKERIKQLTMERDRFYHLSKPATRRADDVKSQQIRDLRAEVKALAEQNHKLQYVLESQAARAQDAYQLASGYKAQFEAFKAAYNTLVTGNPFISNNEPNVPPSPSMVPSTRVQGPNAYIDLTLPKQSSLSQQNETPKRTSSSATATPVMMANGRLPAPANRLPKCPSSSITAAPTTATEGRTPASLKLRSSSAAIGEPKKPMEIRPPASPIRPTKRQRKDSNTAKQPPKLPSMLNCSQMNDIRARLRQELKGKTPSYAWAKEDKSDKGEIGHGTEADKKTEIVSDMGEKENNRVVVQNRRGVETAAQADGAPEEAEDELSELEIAAFDRALEEAWDEAGAGEGNGSGDGDEDSLFGDG